jgi:hypothetical protein
MVVLRSLALAAVLVAFLAACNSVQPGLYAPDKAKGHTEEGMRHDTADCANHMPFASAGNPITICMREKGYIVLWPG